MQKISVSKILPRARTLLGQRSFSLAVRFHATGKAQEVYKLETIEPATQLGPKEVALKFLAAPINPADINMAEGVYGKKPELPAVGGNEGVAVVEKVGSEVSSLKVGDWVLPGYAPFGTWTQKVNAPADKLVKIANDIPAAYAATLSVNPATAYRLLRDFVKLSPGDVIIQNGANSMVGLAVVQMARMMGVKTINIVRGNRPNADLALRLIGNLGGDVNIPDEYLNTHDFNEIMADLPPCKLALNCVGGEVATNMARVLAPGGTMVTYGGMSKQPLSIPYELLNYKCLQLKGFWISHWYEKHSVEDRTKMLDDIVTMIQQKQLAFFYEMHDLDDFDYALKKAVEPFYMRKVVLNLDYPDRFAEHDALDPEEYEVFNTFTN